jgi:carboxypeptidase Q
MYWLLLSVALAKKPPPPPPPPDPKEAAATLIGRALLSDEAWEDLVWLCDRIGHRFNGSPGLEQAVAWGVKTMQDDGFANVRVEPVTLPVWKRGEASARLLGPVPQDLEILALGGSVATPPGGLEADVVVVDSFEHLASLGDAVKGKIVLYDVPFTDYGETVAYRAAGASAAAKQGAVASLTRSVTPSSLDSPHTGTMRYDPTAPQIPAAAVTVEDAEMMRRLQERGVTPRVRLELTSGMAGEAPSGNVVGEVLGREKPDEVVVIGCHLDSWDVGQGAQDDGAGCVSVLGAAALIQRLPVHPRRTIRVVLYVGEEFGVAGGRQYTAAHAADIQKHAAALEIDTGAGQPLGFRVDLKPPAVETESEVSAEARAAASKGLITRLAPLQELLAPLGATQLEAAGTGADIGSLVELGVPGFGVAQDTTGYWPIHHTEADTIDKIDPELLRRNVAVVAVAAWWLAEAPDLRN